MKKNRLNLLVTTSVNESNYLVMAKTILKRVVLCTLGVIVLGTAIMYLLASLGTARLRSLENEMATNEEEVSIVDDMKYKNDGYKSELEMLNAHSIKMMETPTLTSALIRDIVDAGYPLISITRYDFSVNEKTGVRSLHLQGFAENAGDPVNYALALRETLPEYKDTITLTSISTSNQGDLVNFQVSCVMRGVEDES